MNTIITMSIILIGLAIANYAYQRHISRMYVEDLIVKIAEGYVGEITMNKYEAKYLHERLGIDMEEKE